MKSIIFTIAGLALLLSFGCAPTFTKIPTTTGHDSYKVTCNGVSSDWDSCYKKADLACESNTFKVIDQKETVIPGSPKRPMPRGRTVGGVYVAASPYEVLAVNIHNANCGPKIHRKMVVVCAKLSEMTSQEITNKEVAIFKRTHEFFDVVRNDMADLIDLSANNGESLNLQEAYDIAIANSKEVKALRQASNTEGFINNTM